MSYEGKLNRYTCGKCAQAIITIDADEGTTPFAINCHATRGCAGMMTSAFYAGVTGTATHQWRKPTIAEFNRLNSWNKEHVRMGGLLLFPIMGDAA